jgi:hypothetical protein
MVLSSDLLPDLDRSNVFHFMESEEPETFLKDVCIGVNEFVKISHGQFNPIRKFQLSFQIPGVDAVQALFSAGRGDVSELDPEIYFLPYQTHPREMGQREAEASRSHLTVKRNV